MLRLDEFELLSLMAPWLLLNLSFILFLTYIGYKKKQPKQAKIGYVWSTEKRKRTGTRAERERQQRPW